MNYIDEIFERADLGKITRFLLCGGEDDSTDNRPYPERIEDTERKLNEFIIKHYPDTKENTEATYIIMDHISTIEAVNMEIGLQIGAKLAWKIYSNLEIEKK